jgi:type IV pilus assembly protein PilA
VTTNADGAVKVTVQGFGDSNIDGLFVTLAPMANATTLATFAANAGSALYGWRCGSTTDGTTVPSKFLPGSCRG